MLLGGDLVRVDFPDESLTAFGVIAPDQSRAIYSFASVDRSDVALLGRLRLPGLDPLRRYRVSPVLVGRAPSGLRPPRWWGIERDFSAELAKLTGGHVARLVAAAADAGVTLPGAVLINHGLGDAPVNPDHALIYEVAAVD